MHHVLLKRGFRFGGADRFSHGFGKRSDEGAMDNVRRPYDYDSTVERYEAMT